MMVRRSPNHKVGPPVLIVPTNSISRVARSSDPAEINGLGNAAFVTRNRHLSLFTRARGHDGAHYRVPGNVG